MNTKIPQQLNAQQFTQQTFLDEQSPVPARRRSRSFGKADTAKMKIDSKLIRSASASPSLRSDTVIEKRADGYYAKLPSRIEKSAISRTTQTAKSVIVKIGTSTIMNAASGEINKKFVTNLSKDLRELMDEKGMLFTLVISGAVARGRILEKNHEKDLQRAYDKIDRYTSKSAKEKEDLKKEAVIKQKQELAGMGQPKLYSEIADVFRGTSGLLLCETLVTKADMDDIRDNPDTHNAIYSKRFSRNSITVINANDRLCSYQMKSGDNDNLAVRVGEVIRADAVVILSDVDGIYTDRPQPGLDNPDIHHLPYFDNRNMAYAYKIAKGAGTPGGTGGMEAKVKAIDTIAFPNNMSVIISKGDVDHPLTDLFDTDVDTTLTSTWFIPNKPEEENHAAA